jgi:hypothetical protein
MATINMEKEKLLPTNGTLYSVYDFIEHCGKGLFLDSDGKGYYSDGRVYWEDQEAKPSDIVAGKLKFSYKYRYVVWFEK